MLSDQTDKRPSPFLRARRLSTASHNTTENSVDRLDDLQPLPADTIAEESEPPSPAAVEEYSEAGPSMLTSMFKQSPTTADDHDHPTTPISHKSRQKSATAIQEDDTRFLSPPPPRIGNGSASEFTPLLGTKPLSTTSLGGETDLDDLEGQKPVQEQTSWGNWLSVVTDQGTHRIRNVTETLNPKAWTAKSVLDNVIMEPVRCLPAVIVGLLLNILDALSYGRKHFSPDRLVVIVVS